MEAIYDIGGSLELAVTLEDDMAREKSGRIFLDPFAATHDLPLVKCRSINDPRVVETIRNAELDWLFIIGWSQIAKPAVLNATRWGAVGMHPTLLPRGRGRASIPWAILKGLTETGVTMFVLDEGVDTGPIVAQRVVPISPAETAGTLYDKIANAHVQLIRDAWHPLERGPDFFAPQDHSRATYWPGRTPKDGHFDPSRMSVAEVDRHIRALTRPYPGAFTLIDGKKITIWAGERDCQHPQHHWHLKCRDGHYCVRDSDSVPAQDGGGHPSAAGPRGISADD